MRSRTARSASSSGIHDETAATPPATNCAPAAVAFASRSPSRRRSVEPSRPSSTSVEDDPGTTSAGAAGSAVAATVTRPAGALPPSDGTVHATSGGAVARRQVMRSPATNTSPDARSPTR